jgi:diphthamide synthase (EF-2-diphthine--ammonia ligase)
LNPAKEKILFSWSSGKDSTMALAKILAGGEYEVVSLLTTVTRDYDRVTMHGVRHKLLEMQAASIGLPLEVFYISPRATNDEYERNMGEVLARFQRDGVTGVAFGDIFLEDLRT